MGVAQLSKKLRTDCNMLHLTEIKHKIEGWLFFFLEGGGVWFFLISSG